MLKEKMQAISGPVAQANAQTHHKPHPRAQFTDEEDAKLIELVETYGDRNWKNIADKMPGRNTRQCRERYQNYLSPNLDKGPWTNEEDTLLICKYIELGSKWKTIALYFPKRTDISVKNRMHKIARNLMKEGLSVSQAFAYPYIFTKVSCKASKKMRKAPRPKKNIQNIEKQEDKVDSQDFEHFEEVADEYFSQLVEDQNVFAVNYENGFGAEEFIDFTF